MIFDLLSLLTLIGLLVRGLKKGGGKLPLIVSLGISAIISTGLVPVYMKFLNLPKDIPAGAISYIITFIFAYVIISVPTLIFSVIIVSFLIVLIYALIVSMLPVNLQSIIVGNSKIYPMLLPIINSILKIINLE